MASESVLAYQVVLTIAERGKWKEEVCSNSATLQYNSAAITAIWKHFVLNSVLLNSNNNWFKFCYAIAAI